MIAILLAATLAAEPPPNIVYILADDLGWSDFACFGSTVARTPHIDALAAQGLRCTDAYAAPVCLPTRASIMTGKAPARLHMTSVFDRDGGKERLLPPAWTNTLPLDERTLPERLRELGYATACLGKWHLGPPETHWPEHHGFDLNLGGYAAGDAKSFFSPYLNPRLPDGPPGEYLTDRLTAEAERFITANATRPFFIYLSHYAPHTPLQAPEADVAACAARLNGQGNATYAAMIERLDAGVGRIVEALERSGVAGRTIVVVTSDNGGVLVNRKDGKPITSNAPLRGEKAQLYEGGIRVPFLVRWPGVIAPGTVSAVPMITEDHLPTLVAAAGGKADDVDGADLTPLWRGGTIADRDLAWHYPHYYYAPIGRGPASALRHGSLKLIAYHEGRSELYDLAADLGEAHDLALSQPALVAELRGRLDAWRTRVGAQMPTPNPAWKP
jgi:arylsulfatase A-like enzyme